MLEWLTHFRTVVAFPLDEKGTDGKGTTWTAQGCSPVCPLIVKSRNTHLGGEAMDATKGYVQGKRL